MDPVMPSGSKSASLNEPLINADNRDTTTFICFPPSQKTVRTRASPEGSRWSLDTDCSSDKRQIITGDIDGIDTLAEKKRNCRC